MEMALEGRLDEFDPDSVEIPEETAMEAEESRLPQRFVSSSNWACI